MEFVKTLCPIVEVWVCDNHSRPEATSHRPHREDVESAYAYAVENGVTVRLCWNAFPGFSTTHSCYIAAGTDVNRIIEAIEGLTYGV